MHVSALVFRKASKPLVTDADEHLHVHTLKRKTPKDEIDILVAEIHP